MVVVAVVPRYESVVGASCSSVLMSDLLRAVIWKPLDFLAGTMNIVDCHEVHCHDYYYYQLLRLMRLVLREAILVRVVLRERVPLVLPSVHTEDDPLQFYRDLVVCSGSLHQNQNQMGTHCSADSYSLIYFLLQTVSLVASIPPVHFDVPCAVAVAGVVAVAFVPVADDAVAGVRVRVMVVVVAVDASAVVVAGVSVGNVAAVAAAAAEPIDAPCSHNNLQSSSALHECSDTIGWSTL